MVDRVNNKLVKNTVVATKMSNLGFENYLKKLGVNLIRTDVGDINVIEEMNKKTYCLGGEQSGHIILGEYSNTGDGILVALKILEIFKIFKIQKLKQIQIIHQILYHKLVKL